jgi:gliding motility-associated-like protein
MICKRLLSFALLLLCTFTGKAQVTCPPNIDFELGTFANWHYYRGAPSGAESDGGGCCPINTPTYCGYGIACTTPTVRQQIVSGAGADVCCSFPVVPPGGGTFTLKLGNTSTNAQAEKLRYYVNVPAGSSSYSLFYRYAVVLEDPSHPASQQPRFEVRAFDSATNAALPCAQFSYVTGVGLPGFYSVSVNTNPCVALHGSPVRCKAWTTSTLDLSGAAGTTVAVDFATGDCQAGGHFGYAYIDLSCGLFAINAVACGTTTITLSAPGGFAYYSWYDSTNMTPPALGTLQTVVIPTPADTTTYACVIAPYPGYGCPDTIYTRVIPSNLQLHTSNDTAICQGATATLTDGATDIMAPITHAWSPSTFLSCTTCGTVVATPTVTTTYTVTATNPVGCTKTDTIRVEVYTMNLVTGQDSVSCFNYADGRAWVTATGTAPFTYLWSSTPAQTTDTAVGLSAPATYSVTVTGANGCIASASQAVYQPAPRNLTIFQVYDDTTCSPYPSTPGLSANGRIVLKGAGDLSVDPGTGGPIYYTVTYDYLGGTYTQVLAGQPGNLLTLVNLPKGVYSNITVTAVAPPGFWCPYNVVGPVTINDPPLPVIAYINNPTACQGSPITFNTTTITGAGSGAPVSYLWWGPLGFASGLSNPVIPVAGLLSAGTYTFAVATHSGTCHDTAVSNVVVNPKPIPAGATSNAPICAGSTLTLWDSSLNGANSYSWNGPNGFSSNVNNPSLPGAGTTASGVYTVTMVRNGCTNTDQVTVVVNPTPSAPVVHDTEYCQYNLTPAPLDAIGTGLLWYTNPTGGTPLAGAPTPATGLPGVFSWYVTQTSADGCVSARSKVSVKIFLKTEPHIAQSDSSVCLGREIQFSYPEAATSDDYQSIRWTFDNGSVDNVNPVYHSFEASTNPEQTYTVTVNYRVCPNQTVTKTVSVNPAPFINLGADKAFCPGGEALALKDHINQYTPGAKWLWSNGETTPGITVTTAGTYAARVMINGCSSYDTVEITRDCYLDIPNIFSPNGDGHNDYFFPRNRLSKGLSSFSMNIYNRWGELIFQTENLDGRGWDGSYNGVLQPAGVYVFMIDASFKDGRKEHHQGNVTVLK